MFGTSIKLDKDLLNRCKEYAKEAGYSSVEEFIAHTLEKELRNKQKESQEMNENVADRLRGLGYLD
jgi:metal-responsive CopG/Arc/MetJ family transcriptional regulator